MLCIHILENKIKATNKEGEKMYYNTLRMLLGSNCPKCSALGLDEVDKFCYACGHNLNNCPNCNSKIKQRIGRYINYCSNCGDKLAKQTHLLNQKLATDLYKEDRILDKNILYPNKYSK